MSYIPREVPEGAIRYNTDSNKMEVWIGEKWMIVSVSSPNLDGGVRGVIMGGSPAIDIIDFITISTLGDAQDFGDLNEGKNRNGAAASRTRGLSMGGSKPSNAISNTIEFVTFASTGDAQDFGDLNTSNGVTGGAGASNETRALSLGGFHMTPSQTGLNSIDFFSIASTGNSKDFGDLNGDTMYLGGCASPTRAVVAGGFDNPAIINIIQYVTISTTGNAEDFGDLTRHTHRNGGCSNATRGLFSLGEVPGTDGQKIVDSIQIASKGNSTRFGELTAGGQHSVGVSSPTRGVFVARQSPSPYAADVTMDYFQFATEGNAYEFGERSTSNGWGGGSCSNGHGGL